MVAMIQYGCGEYTVSSSIGEPPVTYSTLIRHATLHDDLGMQTKDGTVLVIAVKRAEANWPELVISQRFAPGPEAGFVPGVFLVPENHLLFVGAGTCLLAYNLRPVRRLWEDYADAGFWHWERHGNIVFMSAELELAAWDTYGKKMWSTFVEPPWDYKVSEGQIELDIMGTKSTFSAITGPAPPSKH